jgi:protein subunit release factor A
MGDGGWKVESFYTETGTMERPGGQHAGSPSMSIRVTHEPSGISAVVGSESGQRSQHKQKRVAMEMVKYGLLELGWNVDG